jgi:chromatin remodeling complex protein RSC6
MRRVHVFHGPCLYLSDRHRDSLQDPDNKKMVLCDDALRDLTGEDSFLAFGFAKYMKQHINPQDD